jgi:hypothetical protein
VLIAHVWLTNPGEGIERRYGSLMEMLQGIIINFISVAVYKDF